MTTLTADPSAPTPTTGPARLRRVRAAVRRRRWPLLVTGLILAAGAAGALSVPSTTQGVLDPRSAAEQGSRAVAQILRAHGVGVEVVRRSDAAVAGAGPDSTIVVVDTPLLGPDQLGRLAVTAADLVLVEPDLTTLRALAPQVDPAGVGPARSAPPACADPDAVAAGVTTAGGDLYRVAGSAGPPVTACYPRSGDPTGRDGWSLLRVRTAPHRITVLGQSAVLRNQTLADEGNAALALRVLGARPQLRWYLPDPAELAGSGGAPTLSQLLPSWVRPAGWELAVVAGTALLWRGRRLGRLVSEPLPVVVRSAETEEGRARLYRQAGARGRAAATLRTAAVRRLARRLSAATTAEPLEVVRLAAAVTGRPEPGLREIMMGAPPRDDAALVRLGTALDAVERQVAAATGVHDAPSTRTDLEVGPR